MRPDDLSAGALRILRLGFAALALTAIVVQLFSGSSESAFRALNFFSFFTVQANLIGAAVLAAGAIGRPPRDAVRGAAVLYLVLTGLVFALLLADLQEELQLTKPWVDAVLHQVMPVVLAADWLLDPPEHRLALRAALVWLAFPAAWMLYTFARGAITGWYPYPFIDPGVHGTGALIVNCVAILIGFLAVAALIVAIGNALRRPLAPA